MAKNKKSTPLKAAKKTVAKAKPATKVKKAEPAKAKKAAPAKKTVAKKTAAPKKVVAKKPAAKTVVKKETIKKAEPKAQPKKVVAAVEEPKKVEKIEKKVEKVAPVKKAEVAKVEKEKTQTAVVSVTPSVKTVTPVAAKPAPPTLNIFPVPNQRPIAHKAQTSSPSTDVNRTRYSDEELKEFESLINKKLDKAREEYKILKDTLNRNNDEGTDATSGGNTKVLEDGAETAEKENLSQLAARQQKYITNLENALIRIKNGTDRKSACRERV